MRGGRGRGDGPLLTAHVGHAGNGAGVHVDGAAGHAGVVGGVGIVACVCGGVPEGGRCRCGGCARGVGLCGVGRRDGGCYRAWGISPCETGPAPPVVAGEERVVVGLAGGGGVRHKVGVAVIIIWWGVSASGVVGVHWDVRRDMVDGRKEGPCLR